MTKLIVPLDFQGFKAHEGCARRGFPGGQLAFVRACLTTKVVCALNGRSTGKSVGVEILFWKEAGLTSGHYECVYVAQSHNLAEKTWERHVKLCEAAGKGFLVDRKNKGQDRWVETRGFGANLGTMRHFWSGEPGALVNVRGVRAHRVAVDEAGFVHKDVETTCIPMLGARNGKAAFVGTAKRGGMGQVYFKRLFDLGMSGRDPNYKSFNFPLESSPFISDEECAFMRSYYRDPSNPDVPTSEEQEECSGAFISDLGACFRNLDAAFSLPFKKLDAGYYVGVDEKGVVVTPKTGQRFVCGADWGRKDDHSVSSVFDRLTRKQVALRVEPTNRSYDEYVTRLSALKKYWNDALIISDDRGAGEYANSRLASVFGDRYRGISLTGQGENSKGGYVARMKDLFDMGTWKFLAVPEQKKEFSEYEQVPIGESQNGWRYGAPSGLHDDQVSAAMFASTVLQIDPPKVRKPKPEVEAYSTEWFAGKAKERKRVASRRGLW